MEKLTTKQKDAFDKVMSLINEGGTVFMDAPGGTGKTFTSEIILAVVRSDLKIALAVASTGIASSLLTGGTTAHRQFKIPLDLDKDDKPTCSVEKGTALAKLLQDTALIVWDECTMVHKKAFEYTTPQKKLTSDKYESTRPQYKLTSDECEATTPQ